MDAEYFPPEAPVRQPVLLIDALRMATSVIDECFRISAADSITSLRAFDGHLLFRWFRTVLVLYQTCFRRIALRLHMHAGSVVPFGVLFWMVYLRDFLQMSCMAGHTVGSWGDHTSDLSISLGLGLTAPVRHGMPDLSLACWLPAPGVFQGLISINVGDAAIGLQISSAESMPFSGPLNSIEHAVRQHAQASQTPVSDFCKEVEATRLAYQSALGARKGRQVYPENRDPMDFPLGSAEALMGARPLMRTLTLDCNIMSPHLVEHVEVLLPWQVTAWAQDRLAEFQRTRRPIAPDSAEVLVSADNAPVDHNGDEPANIVDVARILLESMAITYFNYVQGGWRYSAGGAGKPAGREAMAVSVAVEKLWREELHAPFLCIFTHAFWLQASDETAGSPALTFRVPVILKKPGGPLFHFANVLLDIIESPIWAPTETADMLRKAWSAGSDEQTKKLERLALATAIKTVFMRRFPLDTTFAVHTLGKKGKFTGSTQFWKF